KRRAGRGRWSVVLAVPVSRDVIDREVVANGVLGIHRVDQFPNAVRGGDDRRAVLRPGDVLPGVLEELLGREGVCVADEVTVGGHGRSRRTEERTSTPFVGTNPHEL